MLVQIEDQSFRPEQVVGVKFVRTCAHVYLAGGHAMLFCGEKKQGLVRQWQSENSRSIEPVSAPVTDPGCVCLTPEKPRAPHRWPRLYVTPGTGKRAGWYMISTSLGAVVTIHGEEIAALAEVAKKGSPTEYVRQPEMPEAKTGHGPI